MCRTYVEEQIDFPVADVWRDHYYERGLTPYHSPNYAQCRERPMYQMMEQMMERLTTAIEALAYQPQREGYGEPAVPSPPASGRPTGGIDLGDSRNAGGP